MKIGMSFLIFLGIMLNTAFGYTLTIDGLPMTLESNRRVTTTALSKPGYIFLNWNVVSGELTLVDPTNPTITFIMPEDDIVLESIYEEGIRYYSINTEPVSYARTLSDAISLAGDGNTIELLYSTTESTAVTVPSSKNITLNLAGNTIATDASNLITVEGGLTVTDTANGRISSSNSSGKLITLSGSGVLAVNGGTIENTSAQGTEGAGVIYSNSGTTTVTLGSNDGTINNYPKVFSGNGKGIFSKGTVNYYDGEVIAASEPIHAVTDAYATGKTLGETTVSGKKKSMLIAPYTTSGLVNYYSGKWNRGFGTHDSSDVLADLKGSNNGTVYSGTTKKGTFGADYLTFDGTDDWVDLGVKNYSNLSWEAVFSVNNFATYNMEIIANINSGGSDLLVTPTGGLLFQVVNSAGTYVSASKEGVIELGKKYHAVGTYDGTTITVYLNGEKIAEKASGGGITNSNSIVTLGSNPGLIDSSTGTHGGKANWFNGKIYMARIYNKAITAAEVAVNYENEMYWQDLYKVHSGYTLSNNGCCTTCEKQMYTSLTLSWTGGTTTSTHSHGSVVLYKGKNAANTRPSTYTTGKSLYGSTTRLWLGTATYTSSNTSVATVNSSGTPTVKGPGVTDISVSCNGLTDSYRIFAANALVGTNLTIRASASSSATVKGYADEGVYIAVASTPSSIKYVKLYAYTKIRNPSSGNAGGVNGYVYFKSGSHTVYTF